MEFKPDYLSPQASYVDATGRPTTQFIIFWQKFVNALKQAIDGLTANIAAVVAAQADADAAQINADALETPQYLTLANTALLSAERRLVGGTGVVITDGGAGSTATIEIDTVTDLGYTPANKAGETFSGAVDVQAALRCDSLRIDIAASASVATITHSVPVNLNGTTYYLMLSNVP